MSAEDEVRVVLARYVQRLDDRDVEGLISLFTKDALLVGNSGEYKGRSDLFELWTNLLNSTPARRTKHHLGASIVNVKGDAAEARSDIVVFESLNDGPWSVYAVGRYVDKLVIQDSEWRIEERRIES
jgi:ketosteroid isomerase-like protein